MLANGTWDYKPPLGKDIPIEFNVTFLKDAPNPASDAVFSSKATGAALARAAALTARSRQHPPA